jgi:tetratricopeptide (TPR) repeat protein
LIIQARRVYDRALNGPDAPHTGEEFDPRYFSLDIPAAAALLVAVSLFFAFFTISRYGGRAASETQPVSPAVSGQLSPVNSTGLSAETLVNLSVEFYRQKRLAEAISVANQAIVLRPDLAEAWNNKAAALNALGRWDEAIASAQVAVRLKPDFTLAQNNLAWAIQQKTLRTVK